MSKKKQTGLLPSGLEELRREHEGYDRDKTFEEQYCLVKIRNQPPEYDGSQRYCSQYQMTDDDIDFCYRHRFMRHLESGEHTEHLDPTANMSHGLRALRKYLIEDFSDDEREAYETIVSEWQEYYDIEDPSSVDTLESMAVEIVREIRADRMIEEHKNNARYTDEGLTLLKENYGPDGSFQNTEPVPDHIVEYRQKARRLAEKLKTNLGITRKHQEKLDAESSKTETLEAISSSVSDSLDGGEYDPDEFEDPDEGENE